MCFGKGCELPRLNPITDRRLLGSISRQERDIFGLDKQVVAPIGGCPELQEALDQVLGKKKEEILNVLEIE